MIAGENHIDVSRPCIYVVAATFFGFGDFRTLLTPSKLSLHERPIRYVFRESSPEIADFMKKHKMRHVSQVEQHYVRRTLNNVRNLGAKYMIWQDPIDNGVEVLKNSVLWNFQISNTENKFTNELMRFK